MGQYAGEVGPVAIVGIGYAEEQGDYAFVGMRRGLDFYRAPRRSMDMPGGGTLELGGADAFLAALLDTVAPEIERRFPEIAGARRLLFGMSAGGHFAAHALTQRPEAFAAYAMISPALVDFPPMPGDEQMVEAVRALTPGSIPPGAQVFLSAGSREEEPSEPLAARRSLATPIGCALRSPRMAFPPSFICSKARPIFRCLALQSRALHVLVSASGAPSWQAALAASD
jgi:predicted alpha/beta superfamily hydrolase